MRLLKKSISNLLLKLFAKCNLVDTFLYSFLAVFFLITFQNCDGHKKLDIDTLSKVYVDLLVVEDFYSGTDSLKIKKDEIFKKYDIDSSSYYEKYKSLKFDDEKWNEFFNLSQTYLDTLKSNQAK